MSSLFDEMMEEICEKNQKISDLEAKLAEKDQIIENLQTTYQSVMQTCGNDANEIKKLKKQNDDYADSLTKVLNENADLVFKLAEKDEELKNLVLTHFESAINKPVLTTTQIINQDKISFAVEKLEKVKETLYPELRFDYSLYLRVMHEIDNQIKQLKEME